MKSAPPLLPPELEQSIFELTAKVYPRNAYNFALVSRRVQAWMEAILYESVTLSNQKVCKSFLYAVKRRPPSFFATNVKSLCIPGDIKRDHALSILAVCQGVINLAYWITKDFASPKTWPESHFAVISKLRPVHLSINTTGLFGSTMPPDFTHPFFSRVTHLEIVDWLCPVLSTEYELLPSLTHLALDLDNYDESTISKLRHIIDVCVNLRVLLCLVADEEKIINATSAVAALDSNLDQRLVILPDSDVIANWETSLQSSEQCRWTFAEAIIADKGRHELSASITIETPDSEDVADVKKV